MNNHTANTAETLWRSICAHTTFTDNLHKKTLAKEVLKQFGALGQSVNTHVAKDLAKASRYIDDEQALKIIEKLLNDNGTLGSEQFHELKAWLEDFRVKIEVI